MTSITSDSTPNPAKAGESTGRQVDLSRALLTSVARTNTTTLQSGLAKQAVYWSGVAWVMAALEKRIEGFQDVDLVGVTEKLKSFVSMPDAGLLGRVAMGRGADVGSKPAKDLNGGWGNVGAAAGQINYGTFDISGWAFFGCGRGVHG